MSLRRLRGAVARPVLREPRPLVVALGLERSHVRLEPRPASPPRRRAASGRTRRRASSRIAAPSPVRSAFRVGPTRASRRRARPRAAPRGARRPGRGARARALPPRSPPRVRRRVLARSPPRGDATNPPRRRRRAVPRRRRRARGVRAPPPPRLRASALTSSVYAPPPRGVTRALDRLREPSRVRVALALEAGAELACCAHPGELVARRLVRASQAVHPDRARGRGRARRRRARLGRRRRGEDRQHRVVVVFVVQVRVPERAAEGVAAVEGDEALESILERPARGVGGRRGTAARRQVVATHDRRQRGRRGGGGGGGGGGAAGAAAGGGGAPGSRAQGPRTRSRPGTSRTWRKSSMPSHHTNVSRSTAPRSHSARIARVAAGPR